MPTTPTWYRHLASLIGAIDSAPDTFFTTDTLSPLMAISSRQTLRVIRQAGGRLIGPMYVIDKERLLLYFRGILSGDDAQLEERRHERVAAAIGQPRFLVAAPIALASQRIDELPEGVTIVPGKITVEFTEPKDAAEKLVALAMALKNDFLEFENICQRRP